MRTKHYLLILMSSLCSSLLAQDLHFSQFEFAPFNLNPALGGLFEGDQRFGAIVRQQWASVPVPYFTTSGFYDAKLISATRRRNTQIAGGGYFFYDRAGDGHLSNSYLAGNFSVTQYLDKKMAVSAGVQVGIGQRRLSTDRLTWDAQWNGDQYSSILPSGDNIVRSAFIYPDISAGLNWHYAATRRNRFNLGAAVYHINRPEQTFYRSGLNLPIRWTMYATASIKAGTRIDLLPNILVQQQGVNSEYLTGLQCRYILRDKRGVETDFTFGSSYRWGDAAILRLGARLQNWQVGLSYDFNTSGFQVATQKQGGAELALIYTFAKVAKINYFRICPVF